MTPDPFTPADCDLRGLQYMPLFGDRLFGSATWIAASAEGKVAAIRLWWRAYAHEVPAASLPDDDALLADYAGYGVAIKAWLKVKPQAMRGWVLCSDGRLYHKVVSEVAIESWDNRQRNRKKQSEWRSKNRRVTVTQEVTQPLADAGAGQGRAGQGIDLTPTPSVANNAQAREPVSRSQLITEEWEPTQDDRASLAKEIPWLVGEIYDKRMLDFRDWCDANATMTFSPAATWRGFMRKTKPPNGGMTESYDDRRIRLIREAIRS